MVGKKVRIDSKSAVDRSVADCRENIKLSQSAERIHVPQRSTECLVENITYPRTTTPATDAIHTTAHKLKYMKTKQIKYIK